MPPTTDPAIIPPMGVDDPDEVGLGVGGKADVEVAYILDEGSRRRGDWKVRGGNGCCLKRRRCGRGSSTRRGGTIWNRSLWDMVPTITLAASPGHTRLDWRFDPTIVSLLLAWQDTKVIGSPGVRLVTVICGNTKVTKTVPSLLNVTVAVL